MPKRQPPKKRKPKPLTDRQRAVLRKLADDPIRALAMTGTKDSQTIATLAARGFVRVQVMMTQAGYEAYHDDRLCHLGVLK